jgi:hypothetical protein
MSANPTYQDLEFLRNHRYDDDLAAHPTGGRPALLNDDVSHCAVAEPNTILRGLVGSTVHGLVLGGTDDGDEMSVCVEPRRYVVGFTNRWNLRPPSER